MVWQTYKAVKIPIIGLGVIANWKDAVEFMLAGATAIQIGTYNLSLIHILPHIFQTKFLIRNYSHWLG